MLSDFNKDSLTGKPKVHFNLQKQKYVFGKQTTQSLTISNICKRQQICKYIGFKQRLGVCLPSCSGFALLYRNLL